MISAGPRRRGRSPCEDSSEDKNTEASENARVFKRVGALLRRAAPSPIERRSMNPKVEITIFLCGDVMLGRGIDQILPHAGDPTLHEPYVRSASTYVQIGEEKNGPIKRPVDFGYIWGDALAQLERVGPSLRLINLETSVTTSRDSWEGKEVHCRVHPENISCL